MQNKIKITLFILGGLIILGALILTGKLIMDMTSTHNTANLTIGKVLENHGTFPTGTVVLPTESDVRKNIKYGPGSSRTGMLEVPAPLTWSSQAPAPLCWDANQKCSEGNGFLKGEGAVEYCNNLVEGGYSDWRLPTEYEIVKDLADGWVHGGSTFNTLQDGINYWSGSDSYNGTAWDAYVHNGILHNNHDNKSNLFSVICVR